MRISQRSIESVREGVNIVEVASEFTALRRVGARFTGLCPYPDHNEKSPSFGVSPEKGFYHCFGCSRGGDAIKLVMELKNLPFAEAVSHLGERFGIEPEFEGRSPEEERAAKTRNTRRRSAYRALAAATVYYQKYLLKASSSEEARRYLTGRGIESSTIEEFRLGYAPRRDAAGFSAAARRVGLERSALDAAGLLSPRGGERFVDRVTFPISDLRGRIVGFGARTLGDAKPKYLNSPETEIFTKRSLLYGLPQAAAAMRREKSALVVEGYTDVLMLNQSGIKNAVATLGTAMTEQHLKALSGNANTIYLLFDPDDAGEKAVERAATTAAELKLDLRVLRLPEDPADWLLEHPAEEFRDLLSGSVPVLEYVFRRKAESARGSGAAERSRVVAEIKGLIKEIRDPVFHRDAIALASEALRVSPDVVRESREITPNPSSYNQTHVRLSPLQQAGREVLALILARPHLAAEHLRNGLTVPSIAESLKLSVEDFGDDSQAIIFSVLEEQIGQLRLGLDSIFSDERVRPFMEQVSSMLTEGERLYPPQAQVGWAVWGNAWLHLRLRQRERQSVEASDYDIKEQLQLEVLTLRNLLRTVVTPLMLES